MPYAGRLLLLNTVINGITNFWTSTFILPKACITKINSLCSSFLWHGSSEAAHSAKVAWETIMLSKDEGGLGCRDLRAWNKACSIKLIWLLFKSSGSIWVAWFIQEILGGELSTFWTIKPKQRHPWFVKKLLGLRDLAFRWIKVKVGSGASVRFWSDKQVTVQALLSSLNLNTEPDTIIWCVEDSIWDRYSTAEIYSLLKKHGNKVPWSQIIWSKGGIPKHNFIAWLATLNRLPIVCFNGD